MKLAYSLTKPADYADLEPEDIVDGTDDKQIDVISLDERASGLEADILILQAKNQASFSTNSLTLMGSGLGWIFEQPIFGSAGEPGSAAEALRPSVTLLKNIVQKRPEWTENVNNVFKAADVEEAINKAFTAL